MKESYFSRFTIEMKEEDSLHVSQPGVEASACVEEVLEEVYIKEQLAKITDSDLKEELRGYGAWEDLEDRQENEMRIIWIAGGGIREEMEGS